MANIENLGEYLKEIREEKKISVSQVAQALKTKLETIHAIEANDFGKIPAPTYVKGYLRSYAGFLGIDGDPLLMEYNKQYPQEKQPLVRPSQKIPSVNIDIIKVLKSKAFIYSIVSIAIVIFLTVIIFKFSRRKTGTAKKDIPIQAQQPQLKQEEIKKEISQEPQQPEPVSKLKTPLSLPLSLATDALDNVWMRVSADNKIIFEGVLQKNDKEKWQAQNEFKLRIGNPSKLNLIINGQSLGAINPYGPINVIINKDGVKTEK